MKSLKWKDKQSRGRTGRKDILGGTCFVVAVAGVVAGIGVAGWWRESTASRPGHCWLWLELLHSSPLLVCKHKIQRGRVKKRFRRSVPKFCAVLVCGGTGCW
jgi:hypothetical protein